MCEREKMFEKPPVVMETWTRLKKALEASASQFLAPPTLFSLPSYSWLLKIGVGERKFENFKKGNIGGAICLGIPANG